MHYLQRMGKTVAQAAIILIAGAVLFSAPESTLAKKRQFTRKGCLDCHTEFADTYLSMKNVHAPVKEEGELCFLPRPARVPWKFPHES